MDVGVSFDLWLTEQREIENAYKTFSLEQSLPDQLRKFDEIVFPTVKILLSLPTDELSTLSRSDVMFLTTNTLMEYLCGKR